MEIVYSSEGFAVPRFSDDAFRSVVRRPKRWKYCLAARNTLGREHSGLVGLVTQVPQRWLSLFLNTEKVYRPSRFFCENLSIAQLSKSQGIQAVDLITPRFFLTSKSRQPSGRCSCPGDADLRIHSSQPPPNRRVPRTQTGERAHVHGSIGIVMSRSLAEDLIDHSFLLVKNFSSRRGCQTAILLAGAALLGE